MGVYPKGNQIYTPITKKFLFPLDRRGRLGRNVITHAVGARNLGNDAARDAGQYVIGQLGQSAVMASLDSTARKMIGRW